MAFSLEPGFGRTILHAFITQLECQQTHAVVVHIWTPWIPKLCAKRHESDLHQLPCLTAAA